MLRAGLSGLLLALPLICQDLAERPVRGSVRARFGPPLHGARVQLLGAIPAEGSRPILAEVVTRGDGRFEFPAAARPGARVLLVTAAGRARHEHLLSDEDPLDLEIPLGPGRDLRGRVRDAVTGRGIEQARVGDDLIEVRTDADGAFVLGGAGFQPVALQVSAPGYVPEDVQSGADALEIGLRRGHVLAIRVLDGDGRPAAGIPVEARIPAAVPYTAVERTVLRAPTGADGTAMIEGIPPGMAVVPEIQRPDAAPIQGDPVKAHPFRGEGAQVASVVLGADRRVEVRVEDGHGRPLAGARVRILPLVEPRLDPGGPTEDRPDRPREWVGTTTAEGWASFPGLPAGRLLCEARAAGRRPVLDLLSPERTSVVLDLAWDPEPPLESVPWSPSVAEAWEEARRTGLPILFSMAMDGERANDRLAHAHFRDPEVVRVLREFPAVLASVFGPGGVSAGPDHREEEGLCTRYGAIPCAAHQAAEPYCVGEFLEPGIPFSVPRQILVSADGRILAHRVYYLGERELIGLALSALREAPGDAAMRLARERLRPLLSRLLAGDAAAAGDLAVLANSGDEHAVTLVAGLEGLGVPGGQRRRIVEHLILGGRRAASFLLEALLSDPDPEVRAQALGLAGDAPFGAPVAAALLRAAGDPAPAVRQRARGALGIDRGPESAIERPDLAALGPAILAAAGGEDRVEVWPPPAMVLPPGAVAAGMEVIARGASRPGFAHLLLRAAHDPRFEVAASALLLLGEAPFGDEARIHAEAAILRGLAHEEPLLREAALRAAWRRDPRDRDRVRAALRDPHPGIRAWASIALARSGDLSALPQVLEAVRDPEHEAAARDVLRRLAEDAVPRDAAGWREWLQERGLLEEDRSGR
jgi:HEAT repeat protein